MGGDLHRLADRLLTDPSQPQINLSA